MVFQSNSEKNITRFIKQKQIQDKEQSLAGHSFLDLLDLDGKGHTMVQSLSDKRGRMSRVHRYHLTPVVLRRTSV